MRSQIYTTASRTTTFLRLPPAASHDSASRAVSLKPLIALAMALLLLPIIRGELFAQQAPDNGQYAPDPQSGNQQPGNEQPSYEQPGYAQPQPSSQQPYPQQAYPAPGQTNPQPGYGQGQPQNVQPLNAEDLEQLVAPIALYPDALVAQMLTASTYPEQVADADRWRQAQGYASPEQIAAGADAQPWDPSVKALTAFPQVLAQMDQNLHWTTDLGNAYYNQPQDVLQAVQVMRQRARAAGNLQSTPQEAVNYDQGNIVLAPVNPQVIYVPVYNPWVVYGQPVAPYPGFSFLGAVGSFIGSSFGPAAVRFGLGIAMTAFTHTPFGLLAWGLNWLTQSVLFHGSNYYSHSTTVADWGLPHGGPRAFSRRGARDALTNGSYRTFGGYTGYSPTSAEAYKRFQPPPDRSREYRSQEQRFQQQRSLEQRSQQQRSAQYKSQDYRSQQYRSQEFRSPQYRSRQDRSQRYSSPGYGSSFNSRSAENYGSRASAGYGSSMRGNRTPGASFQSGDSGKRHSRGLKDNGFAKSSGKRAHSSGFHFGGGHAPKAPRASKSFTRTRSGGDGHFGGHAHSGGKHRG
jgi:Protein of unknown function (DUF3300)